jgi:hypothetical protein
LLETANRALNKLKTVKTLMINTSIADFKA